MTACVTQAWAPGSKEPEPLPHTQSLPELPHWHWGKAEVSSRKACILFSPHGSSLGRL